MSCKHVLDIDQKFNIWWKSGIKKGGIADFEVGLRIKGTHMVSIIPKKIPAAVTGFPKNLFISLGETPQTTNFYKISRSSHSWMVPKSLSCFSM